MPNKVFLETYQLYRKFYPEDTEDDFDYDEWESVGSLPRPAIHMYCDYCKSEQTFTFRSGYGTSGMDLLEKPERRIRHVIYVCSSCNKFTREYFIRFGYSDSKRNDDGESKIYVEKVGQIPSWKKDVDKEVAKHLGKNADLYEKGLTCESSAYGIGAYAYFRRMTEVVIDDLIVMLSEMLDEEGHKKYDEIVKDIKSAKDATSKIELVKDLLPASLRPGGINPLAVLHDVLSDGIHSRTDEECLDDADKIKTALVYLFSQMAASQRRSQEFSQNMRQLLDKKVAAKTKRGNK